MNPTCSALFRRIAVLLTICGVLLALPRAGAQGQQTMDAAQGESELLAGIELTHKGQFQQAIPHLLNAQGRVRDDYAARFNLALCYVATHNFQLALDTLSALRGTGRDTPEMNTLVAQSYVGLGQPDNAFAAVQRVALRAAKNEKLYLFVLDACMEAGTYDLGLKVTELGLKSLPNSAHLRFERAEFLTLLDRFDDARSDFDRAVQLAPGTDIAYIAAAQKSFYEGDMKKAMLIAREGIEKGNNHFLLLAIYGDAVMRAGIPPDRPEFADAVEALQRVVASHPNYASAQIALGKLYLLQNRLDDAIAHLEAGRALDPDNPSVYSNLATAYRRRGNLDKAREMLAALQKINREQVERINSAPGDRKAGYTSHVPQQKPHQ